MSYHTLVHGGWQSSNSNDTRRVVAEDVAEVTLLGMLFCRLEFELFRRVCESKEACCQTLHFDIYAAMRRRVYETLHACEACCARVL